MSNGPKVETAFLVYKEVNGGYVAVTDIEVDATQDRKATKQDVKMACMDLLDAIKTQAMIEALKSATPIPETPSSSIREALTDRGIL
jgi:hypothetical protein